MKSRTFDNGLVVKHRRSAIILEKAGGKDEAQDRFTFAFSPEELKEFTEYLTEIANESWSGVTPKEANSMASDYDEYYDRKYDNNGGLSITQNGLWIEAPHTSKDTLYQFNKAKIQSFIYDLIKKTESETKEQESLCQTQN